MSKQFGEEIKVLDDRIDVLVRILRSGSEFREVRCEYRNNHETGLRELIRTDTGEVIDTVGLSLFDDETGSENSADESNEAGEANESTSDGEAEIVHVPGEGEGEWEEAEEGPRALIGDGSEDADYEIVHVPGEGEGEWEEAEEGPRALIGDGSEDADYEIVEDEEESSAEELA